eukprot:CAMPEP_0197305986 /NCGR_PEP_ID=MMETSP0891-20130614/2411_1 /TAXON_ID=44058 ORGANISM="Aureoumbra lagunensis, Strain CCMP1510" /NCGR_SAMPLE_ID=MMETSP0891 /ASSEMBLY_ACC=CAM_ASM_000534 /LENGTH=52 /DNA_ID=CAMNT_0042787643 /DNA_START=1786 /DNA_END=1944 /DNA_ORIENTATION=+
MDDSTEYKKHDEHDASQDERNRGDQGQSSTDLPKSAQPDKEDITSFDSRRKN